MKQRLVTWVS